MTNLRPSLTLKLTSVVLLISLLSVMLVALFTSYATVDAFDRRLLEKDRGEFIALISAYYEEHGSWEGLRDALTREPAPPFMFMELVLADRNGRVVIPDQRSKIGDLLPVSQLEQGIAVELNGEHIGTVIENKPRPMRKPEDELYLKRSNQALLLAAGGVSALALLLGLLGSRVLTRPLQELTRATQAISQGDLEQTVPVRTQDELGQLAASFNRMSAALARSNELRRQMTADIAHDLRTPLTVIKGYTEALRDGDLPPTQATFETMYQEAQHLSLLIDDLRTLSLADAGELTLNLRPISPRDLLTQAQSAYIHQAQEIGVTLRVQLADNLPDVNVDPERLARVLGNLISNALRHTPNGGQITLTGDRHADRVLLRVQDTGEGIAPDDLPNVFNRFYRGDPSRYVDDTAPLNDEASGLGLAIAKSLIEAHGGNITVTSSVGQGATFEIALSIAAQR